MKDAEKTPIIGSKRMLVSTFVLVPILLFMLYILPIYMQNRWNSLVDKRKQVSNVIDSLEASILEFDLEINRYASFEFLEVFADSTGLGLYEVPLKVQGGRK